MAADIESQPPPSPPSPLSLPPAQDGIQESLLQSQQAPLDRSLRRLEAFLSLFGFQQSPSPLRFLFSCSTFVVLGIGVPATSIYLSFCSEDDVGRYQIERYDLYAFVFEAILAASSLVCVSRNLFKYGIRKFLFVDQHHGQVERFQTRYVNKIRDYFRLLSWWILPCFLAKIAREVVRFIYVQHNSKWISFLILVTSTISWIYLTVVFLSACGFFNLVCNLQVIHFEDFCTLLERETDPLSYLEQHVRLRYNLSKISHRFRIYLLLIFCSSIASQFVTLFQTTGYSRIVNFINAGDLVVSSVVQVIGIVLCLHAAAKISHRAQSIGSIASKWHAFISCASSESSHPRTTNNFGNPELISVSSLVIDFSESDLESVDNIKMQPDNQLLSHLATYHKRQALVMYFQANPGGVTIFGYTIDRALLNTLFFFELTIVLFILGKTIVLSTD